MATKFLLQDSRYKTTTLKKHLIQHLIISGSSSIADIAKELQLSIPTVTKFVSELMNDNYILDLGKQNTPGGRKPNIYGLNPNAGYFVGVDVEVKKVLLATIDFCGNVIDEGYVVRYNLEDTEEASKQSIEVLKELLQEYANNPYSHPYSYILVSHFLETDFNQYLNKLKKQSWLSKDTIPAKALYIYATKNGYKNDILNVFIKIFKNSSSFIDAYNSYASLIEPFFNEMEKSHIENVVAAIILNNQIYNSINIRKRDFIIDSYCKKFLGENFSIAEEINKTISKDK